MGTACVFDEIQTARDARIPHTEFHGQSSDSENATRLSAKRAHVSTAWRQVVTEKRDARGKAAATLALVKTAFIDAAAARGFVEKLARRRKVDGDVAIFVDFALVAAHAAAIRCRFALGRL